LKNRFEMDSDKAKSYNADVKKRNTYLDAAIRYAKSGQTLAGQQKGFATVKELKKLSDDMEHVSDWLDIVKRKEVTVSLTEP
jgi:hypothetical protein